MSSTGTSTSTSTSTWGGPPPLGIIGGTEWAVTSIFGISKKKDMKRLILRSLANQGCDDAVKKFIMEAGPDSGMDLGIWIGFLEVQKDLMSGNMDDAVEKLNNLNPEILNKDLRLLCILLLQQFVELIRTGKVAEALEFSQERLAPVIKKNPPFFKDFAEITSLLYFKDDPDSPAAKFLDTLWRSKTANEVKDAILRSQGHEKDWNVNVPGLLKEFKLVQHEMEKLAVYPGFGNVSYMEQRDILRIVTCMSHHEQFVGWFMDLFK